MRLKDVGGASVEPVNWPLLNHVIKLAELIAKGAWRRCRCCSPVVFFFYEFSSYFISVFFLYYAGCPSD